MRVPINAELRFGFMPIEEVKLNLNCRDEIIPILRSLQRIYGQPLLRSEILALVENDVNGQCSRKRGRPGLDYWEIIVLAGVRLGCNLNYDALQDLAENHQRLRLIMGVGTWDEKIAWDWRRLRDNIDLLTPATLTKLNQLLVAEGHKLAPHAAKSVRGDTFVSETNIHYPTDSSLIGDGLRKLVANAAPLAVAFDISGWRQHEHLLRRVKQQVRQVARASRSKGKNREAGLQAAYKELFQLADELVTRTKELLVTLAVRGALVDKDWLARQRAIEHFLPLTEKVISNGKRRVLHGETVPNSDKLFSIYEPHTELIKRGKAREPIQFGHKVLIIEDAAGFICQYHVLANGTEDQQAAVPALKELQERLGGQIEHASFDCAFHTPQNQKDLQEIVSQPCVPKKGKPAKREGTVEFRRARQHHPGVESAIGALQAGNGLKRCRDRSETGYQRYVGLGILGRNLHVLGKLLIAKDNADAQAGKSKRKPNFTAA